MTSEAGRRAAWDTYLAATKGLLPALRDGDGDINPRLGAVVIRIRRYAPMWPDDGPMLLAAACGAVRLLRRGDRGALIALSSAIAHRLFALSAGPAEPHHPGLRNRKAAWNKRREPSHQHGFDPGRNTRHHRQQKGSTDD